MQGVLSTMMSSFGAQQGNGESIAQFVQRLSQTNNLFAPGSGDAVGESLNEDIVPNKFLQFTLITMVVISW